MDRKGAENPIADNLSWLVNVLDDPLPIDDSFPDEPLAAINIANSTPWYADYANYIFVYTPFGRDTDDLEFIRILYVLHLYILS